MIGGGEYNSTAIWIWFEFLSDGAEQTLLPLCPGTKDTEEKSTVVKWAISQFEVPYGNIRINISHPLYLVFNVYITDIHIYTLIVPVLGTK